MDPITDSGDRLPAPRPNADPQPYAPHLLDRAAAQQGPNIVFYPVFIEREAPRPIEQTRPQQPGPAWRYVQLGFVGLAMGGGGVLYGLGHPAEAVVSVLIGCGLGAVKILKKLG